MPLHLQTESTKDYPSNLTNIGPRLPIEWRDERLGGEKTGLGEQKGFNFSEQGGNLLS